MKQQNINTEELNEAIEKLLTCFNEFPFGNSINYEVINVRIPELGRENHIPPITDLASKALNTLLAYGAISHIPLSGFKLEKVGYEIIYQGGWREYIKYENKKREETLQQIIASKKISRAQMVFFWLTFIVAIFNLIISYLNYDNNRKHEILYESSASCGFYLGDSINEK